MRVTHFKIKNKPAAGLTLPPSPNLRNLSFHLFISQKGLVFSVTDVWKEEGPSASINLFKSEKGLVFSVTDVCKRRSRAKQAPSGIQITLVLVFIFSRYWSKSIIRVSPRPPPWAGARELPENTGFGVLRSHYYRGCQLPRLGLKVGIFFCN